MEAQAIPERQLSEAETAHIRRILIPHQKRGKTLTIAIFCIAILANILAITFMIMGYRDLKFFLMFILADLIFVFAWLTIRRQTFMYLPPTQIIHIEGYFGIAKMQTKKGVVERYLIGDHPVIMPADWLASFKVGETVSGEVFPLENGYNILLRADKKNLQIK